MSVIGSNILAGASGQGGGYNLTKSLRFRSSASAYLNRTPASATNQKTFTWSGWVKRGTLGTYNFGLIFCDTGSNSDKNEFGFFNTDSLFFEYTTGGNTQADLKTTQVFRDPSAWYHIVLAVDTTQATASNRIKMYVNGSQITSFSASTYPSQNTDMYINSTNVHDIGRGNRNSGAIYLDAYLTELNFIDGQALTPSSFGETSTSTGVWIPKKYTGTYGTNGFYLDFEDTSSTAALGYDAAGSNDWTVNNISLTAGSTYDSMNDVPTLTSATTANYCTLNPLFNPNGSIVTYSNGNLNFSHSSGTANQMPVQGTIALPAGKFYWEYTVGATVNDQVGIATAVVVGGSADGTAGARYLNGGTFQSNYTNPASAASYTTADVIGMAYDQPNGTLAFYKNNSLQGTITVISTSEVFFPSRSPNSSGSGGAGSFNFGQQPFAYTPPTGYVALNTFNLPTPTIGATASSQANKYMDISLYTGTGSSQSITGLNFQPDWTWIKGRSGATDHGLYDAVRGVQKQLESNNTDAETTETTGLTAFNSNGFTVGALAQLNTSSATYVGWNWKANGSGSTNTAGSITSTVSANTTAGFSIVTYTGTGANATVGHGLGVAPSMVIVKCRSTAGESWHTYHVGLSSLANTVYLNGTAAQGSFPTCFNSMSTLNSTVFSLGTDGASNGSGRTYVSYVFAQVAGYSAFGSYTGNGSTDGPFIFTGFRPRYVMIKRSNTTGDWIVYDSARSNYNGITSEIYPNLSNAEDNSSVDLDFVSNGIKLRNSGSGVNASGDTYIYMAFAESPFKFANAR